MISKDWYSLRKYSEDILIFVALIVIYGTIIALVISPYLFSILKENALLIVSGLVVLFIGVAFRGVLLEKGKRAIELEKYEVFCLHSNQQAIFDLTQKLF